MILLCYSVANPNSLNNLRHKWIAEVREFLPKVPVLVVATQTDHREMGPYRTTCTTSSEGKQVHRRSVPRDIWNAQLSAIVVCNRFLSVPFGRLLLGHEDGQDGD